MKYILNKQIIAIGLFFGITLSVQNANAQSKLPDGTTPMIVTPHKQVTDYKERTFCFNIAANVDYSVTSNSDWVTARKGKDGNVYIKVSQNFQNEERKANIVFENTEKGISSTLSITQGRDQSVDYAPTDIYIKPTSASDNSHTTSGKDGDITRSYDGNTNTNYHSNYSGGVSEKKPVILIYNFTGVERIDYLNYVPRTGGGNGDFGVVNISYKLAGDTEYRDYGTYDWEMTSDVKSVTFKDGLKNPVSIKFVVTSGREGFASCAEMQFYEKNLAFVEDYKIFADDVFSKLNDGVTEDDINKLKSPFLRNLATQIFSGNYRTDYRVSSYPCLQSVGKASEIMKISSLYDQTPGVTGISFSPGKYAVIVGGLPEDKTITLKLVAWYNGIVGDNFDGGSPQQCDFPLKNGINVIDYDPESSCTFAEGGYKRDYDALGYIDYNDKESPESYPDIRVHFVNGIINGYLSPDKTNEEMHEITANAKNYCMDAVGSKIHSVWTAKGLHNYCISNEGGLGYRQHINLLDSLLQWEHELLGYEKYGRVPKIRSLSYVNFTYFLFQGYRGVAIHYKVEEELMNCLGLTKTHRASMWGISHEWGHQHQFNYFCWKGMTEISNNLNSYHNVQRMGGADDFNSNWPYARKYFIEDNLSGVNRLSGDRGRAYRYADDMKWNNDFYKLCLSMADSTIATYASNPERAICYKETDLIKSLTPFVMLYAYFTQNGKPDFGPDWFEALRQTDEENGSTIEKNDGYDKYEIIAMAQNYNTRNAIAMLNEKYPESVWNGYITTDNCKSWGNSMPFILNYIRKMSRLSGYNLFPYFERWGFLRCIALYLDDYGYGWQIFTKAAYDEFKADMDKLVADGTLKEMPDGMLEDISYCPDLQFETPNFPN